MNRGAADTVAQVVCGLLQIAELPIGLRCWDGSRAGPVDGPTVVVRSRRALRRLVWSPNQLGLGRAYVTGEIDVDGDLFAALQAFDVLTKLAGSGERLTWRNRGELLAVAVRLGALGPRPQPPAEEVAPATGMLHSLHRDRAAIAHHYDVGNDFYRLVLGESMTYSCGFWEQPGIGVDAAQEAKLDLVARKLGLRPGMRLLDVGCGWGSMIVHAAVRYGVDAVGVTLSEEQASAARRRIAELGLTGRVQVRVQDYREIDDGPYDAISSIGMAEHVGAANAGRYAGAMYALLRPGGRLLNHAITQVHPGGAVPGDSFVARYVFPDGELLTVPQTVTALAGAGFEIRDLQALREHYGLTLRAWVDRLGAAWDQAVSLVGEGRARVWKIYMSGSALGFESGQLGVNQTLAVRPRADGSSEMPLGRPESWVIQAPASVRADIRASLGESAAPSAH